MSDPATLLVRIPAGLSSKQKLFAVLADKLQFPSYFGWNWDACDECLRDLSWLPAGHSIVIVHEDLPFGVGGQNRQIYRDVLQSALDHWTADRSRSLQIIWPESLRAVPSP